MIHLEHDLKLVPNDPTSATENANKLNACFEGTTNHALYEGLDWPAKAFFVNKRLVTPRKNGALPIWGKSGISGFFPEIHRVPSKYDRGPWAAPISRLVWCGSPDEPMVDVQGRGMVFNNLCLQGQYVERGDAVKVRRNLKPSDGALYGVCVDDRFRAYGSGAVKLNNVTIVGCQKGMLNGTTEGGNNSDQFRASHLQIMHCDVAIESNSIQAIGGHVENAYFNQCGCVFQSYGGLMNFGVVDVNGGGSEFMFFRVRGKRNVHSTRCHVWDLRLDATTGPGTYSHPLLFDCRDYGVKFAGIKMTVDCLFNSGANNRGHGVLAVMNGNAELNLHHAEDLTKRHFHLSSAKANHGLVFYPVVRVVDCRYRHHNRRVKAGRLLYGGGDRGSVMVRDCYTRSGLRVKNSHYDPTDNDSDDDD